MTPEEFFLEKERIAFLLEKALKIGNLSHEQTKALLEARRRLTSLACVV